MTNSSPNLESVVIFDYEHTIGAVHDCDDQLAMLRQLRNLRDKGSACALITRRGAKATQELLEPTGACIAFAEHGYVLVDSNFDADMVPPGFFSLCSAKNTETPLTIMIELGVSKWAEKLSVDGVNVLRLAPTPERRTTLPGYLLHDFMDAEELQKQLRKQFGPGLTVIDCGPVESIVLPNGSYSTVSRIAIVPCGAAGPTRSGSAHALRLIADRLRLDTSQIHVCATTKHELQSALTTGTHVFGVSNCDDPNLWKQHGAWVSQHSTGYGLSEYIERCLDVARPSTVLT